MYNIHLLNRDEWADVRFRSVVLERLPLRARPMFRLEPYLCFVTLLIAGSVGSSCTSEFGLNEISVRDSAGVRIVENPAFPSTLLWRVGPTPLVQIGGADESPAYELYTVSDAVRLTNGTIVVANHGTKELRYYSADGSFTLSAGRRGGGPGEFESIWWLEVIHGDSVVAYDRTLRRVSVFSPDGAFVRSVAVRSSASIPVSSPIGMFSDKSMLAQGSARTGPGTPNGLQRYDQPYYHLDAAGWPENELGQFTGTETYYRAFERGFSFHEAVFPRTTRIVPDEDIFYVATGDSYEIRVHNVDGTLSAVVRRDVAPVEVANHHIELERRRRLRDVDRDNLPRLEGIFEETPKPTTFPAYGRIHVDQLRNLWVQDYPVPGTNSAAGWSVFDHTGVLRAEVAVPIEVRPTHIGADFLVGIVKDGLGVEYVRLYPLHKP